MPTDIKVPIVLFFFITREDTAILKDGEISKTKCYSAECWCERPLTETDLVKLAGIKVKRISLYIT